MEQFSSSRFKQLSPAARVPMRVGEAERRIAGARLL
jgi:hypothetical protein